MSLRHCVYTSLFLLALLSPLSAQESISAWLEKLRGNNYTQRERAARALELRGAEALPALEKLIDGADLETKRRAVLIVDRIQERICCDEAMQATSMRFRYRDLDLQDALRDIEKRTGLRCSIASDKRITALDTGTAPFWQAWQRFCESAQLEESDLTRRSWKLKPNVTQAKNSPQFLPPFLEIAKPAAAARFAVDDRHSIRVRVKWQAMSADKTPQAIFAVEVRAEPRLGLATLPRVEFTKLIDADGREMIPPPAQSEDVQLDGLVHFKSLPWSSPIRTVKEMHGRVQYKVFARPRLAEVKNVLKSAGKEMRNREGVTVKILAAERTAEGDIRLHLLLKNLESLSPKTLQEQAVRNRAGVILLRGPVDVALERLGLAKQNGLLYRCEETVYREVSAKKGHEVYLLYAASEERADEPTLVLYGPERIIAVQMPFVVHDVLPPVVMGRKD